MNYLWSNNYYFGTININKNKYSGGVVFSILKE